MPDTSHTNALKVLGLAWARPDFTSERAALYLEGLADIPPDVFAQAIRTLIATHEGDRPSVARIRRAVVEASGLIPTEAEARRQAADLLTWRARRVVPVGAGRRTSQKPDIHPAVLAAVDACPDLSHPPSFLRAYRDAANDHARQLAVGNLSALPALAAPSAPALPKGQP